MKESLKELRIRANLTQEEVAKIADIDRTSYSKIEAGERNPSLRVAFEIAKVFNKKIEDIFLPARVSKGHENNNQQLAKTKAG